MPMNTTFSDAALRQAAQRLAQQMSAALPAEDAGFSAGSDTRMEPLLRRERHRRTARLIWRRTAAALLAIVMAFGAALAVSPTARAAVGRWLRQMTTEVVAYRFPASQSAGTWTGDGPTWLPDGYVMASDFTGDNGVRTVRYTSPQGDVMLAAVGFLPETLNTTANAVVSFVCAMQVQTFRKVRGHAYASTMCIGNMRSGTEALCAYFHTGDKEILHKALTYFGVVLLFALGAGVGSIATLHWGAGTIWLSCGLLTVSFLIMFVHDEEQKLNE